MGHWGLVLGARCPSWASLMPTDILKFQIRLFYNLKTQVVGAFQSYVAFFCQKGHWTVAQLYNLPCWIFVSVKMFIIYAHAINIMNILKTIDKVSPNPAVAVQRFGMFQKWNPELILYYLVSTRLHITAMDRSRWQLASSAAVPARRAFARALVQIDACSFSQGQWFEAVGVIRHCLFVFVFLVARMIVNC